MSATFLAATTVCGNVTGALGRTVTVTTAGVEVA